MITGVNRVRCFIKKLHKISMREKLIESERKRKRESVIKNRLLEIDTLIQETFEKNVSGLLPDNMMKSLLDGDGVEKLKLESELPDLQADILRAENQTSDISVEIENLKKYSEIKTLNRKIVTNLIQSIHVSEPRAADGEKVYDIEIRYKFQNPHIRLLESKKENTPSANEVSSESCGLSPLKAI